jgi:phosphatidylserine/phosphatidylglycerophosphate/cardiolipin synthase-like enzyme
VFSSDAFSWIWSRQILTAQALTRAADRGVAIRIYLDGTQFAEREPAKVFLDLAETPGVEIRVKRDTGTLMHLKSYQIDGRWLRTGAANFSTSGLKRQDNDLIVIESAEGAAPPAPWLQIGRDHTMENADRGR